LPEASQESESRMPWHEKSKGTIVMNKKNKTAPLFMKPREHSIAFVQVVLEIGMHQLP
jgi:hypothetical protein